MAPRGAHEVDGPSVRATLPISLRDHLYRSILRRHYRKRVTSADRIRAFCPMLQTARE